MNTDQLKLWQEKQMVKCELENVVNSLIEASTALQGGSGFSPTACFLRFEQYQSRFEESAILMAIRSHGLQQNSSASTSSSVASTFSAAGPSNATGYHSNNLHHEEKQKQQLEQEEQLHQQKQEQHQQQEQEQQQEQDQKQSPCYNSQLISLSLPPILTFYDQDNWNNEFSSSLLSSDSSHSNDINNTNNENNVNFEISNLVETAVSVAIQKQGLALEPNR